MSTEQTVDWADPAALEVLGRVHRQASLNARRVVPLLGLSVIGLLEWRLFGSPRFLWVAAGAAVLMVVVTRLTLGRLRRAARASGVTTYRLDDVLHVQNSLGQFQIPFAQMTRCDVYPAGVLLRYAGHSTLTLPKGPLAQELVRRLKSRPTGGPL